MDNKTLIIEIPYAGLGDHLFHSHLPRIAKETGEFEKVFISNRSPVRNDDYKKLVWEYNPFVDGYSDEEGVTCKLWELVEKVSPQSNNNLLDEVMLAFGLDNGKRWNEPEIYYKPKFRDDFNHTVYDPNYLSWVGAITSEECMKFFRKNNYYFEKIMKKRSEKFLYIPTENTEYMVTPTIEDFCDLIYSCKELYCLTSGTATIAAGLGKSATVFYGSGQSAGFRHSKLHIYKKIPTDRLTRIKAKIKKSFNL